MTTLDETPVAFLRWGDFTYGFASNPKFDVWADELLDSRGIRQDFALYLKIADLKRQTTRDTPEAALDRVLAELREEVGRARAKHAPMHSPHEGWAVIREELDPELWEHVCHDTGRSPEARHEALQVAAMGVRYILDLIDDAGKGMKG